MPLLRRQPFIKQKPPKDLTPDESVFLCKLTGEIFRDYEEFFERIILCNSLVWTCSITGRSGLTYQEAIEAEEKAKKQLSSFPEYLQKPILYLATLTHRPRLNDLNDDVFVFSRDRYYIGEVVDCIVDGEKKPCQVTKVIPPGGSPSKSPSKQNGSFTEPIEIDDSDSDVVCLDEEDGAKQEAENASGSQKSPMKDAAKSKGFGADPLLYQYVVTEVKKKGRVHTVKNAQISRKKGLFTREKCKLFLKQHCDPEGDGVWKVKARYIKKFKLKEAKFENFFDGPTPVFSVAQVKKKQQTEDECQKKLAERAKKNMGMSEDEMIRQAKLERKERKKMAKELMKKQKAQDDDSPGDSSKLSEEEKKLIKEKDMAEKLLNKEEKQKKLEELKATFMKLKQERKLQRAEMKQKIKLEKKRQKAEMRAEIKEKRRQEKIAQREAERAEREAERQKKLAEREEIMRQVAEQQKLSVEERAALKEQLKQERLKERETLKEERRKILEEEKKVRKEEREREKERMKEEKRVREEMMKEWSRPRDDLECDDLKDMPVSVPIQMRIPTELFGDMMTILEYLQCFNSLFDMHSSFPEGLSLDTLTRALQDKDVSGLYGDLLKFLLTAIFSLQEEEQEEEEELEQEGNVTKSGMPSDLLEGSNVTYTELVRTASIAAQWPQLCYSSPLSKLHLDAYTLTEVVRLHFLSSGAKASESNSKFRFQERGAYTSLDDAGLEFRKNEPLILKELGHSNVFDLDAGDKLKVLNGLINQLLTYVASRDFIEESAEQLRQTRYDLKQHQYAEQKRERDEQTFWYKKRIEERQKEKQVEEEKKAQKKKERENQLRYDELKKQAIDEGLDLAKLLKDAGVEKPVEKPDVPEEQPPSKETSPKTKKEEPERISARKREQKEKEIHVHDIPTENIDWESLSVEERQIWKKKYEEHEEELYASIHELQHAFAVYPLGRDRTFRRYWVFRSVPGLFVEDAEEYVPDDLFQAVEQTGASNPFMSDSLPFKKEQGLNMSGEEKSTSSDKENDAEAAIKAQQNSSRTLNGANGSQVVEITDKDDVEMEVDSVKPSAPQAHSVFDQIANRTKVSWSYYNTTDQLDGLIEALNPRGYREGPLKMALLEQRKRLVESIVNCPTDLFVHSMETDEAANVRPSKVKLQKSGNRKAEGAVKNQNGSEMMELVLRDMMLDLEDRIYAGTLGVLKVKDRQVWRDKMEHGNYDMQCDDMDWPGKDKLNSSKLERMNSSMSSMDGDESDDEASPVVSDLTKALLQIERMIDSKYLNPPLGEDEDTKREKQKLALEKAFKGLKETPRKQKDKKSQDDGDSSSESDDEEEDNTPLKSPLERWEESLMSCTSLSQVFLHLSVLDKSIAWSKSSLNARCRLCRRKGDGDKMLLCDGCDRGHHMYCLKPAVKHVPQGDWYCPDCKPKDLLRTPRKQRRKSSAVSQEEEEEEDDSDDEDDDSDDEDGDSDDDSSDDSDEDSDDDDSDADSSEEEEEKPQTKIKLKGLKAGGVRKVQQTSSGRSTPNSVRSGASGKGSSAKKSRESTPKEDGKRSSGKGRQSLNTSHEAPKSRRSVEKPKKRPAPEDSDEDSPGSKKATTSKSRGNDETQTLKQASDLVVELTKHEDAWPFLKPVNKKDAPDYFNIIAEPMDFSTIRMKIHNFEYTSPAEIVEDMRLIFKNCQRYNVETAEVYQLGQRMARFLEKRVKELKLATSSGAAKTKKPTSRRSGAKN